MEDLERFPCQISDLTHNISKRTVGHHEGHKAFMFCLPAEGIPVSKFSFRDISNYLSQTTSTNLDIPKSPESLSKPVVIIGLQDISSVL